VCDVTTSPSKRPTERFRAESLGKRLKGGELDRLRGAMDLPWWTVHGGLSIMVGGWQEMALFMAIGGIQ
jgi:hypothetical protein